MARPFRVWRKSSRITPMPRYFLFVMIAIGACAPKTPTVEAPPAAAEQNIQLCVVDTIAPGGMMTIGAIVVPATNDTLVLHSEGRIPVRELVAGPQVLCDAKWLSVRQPLQLARLRFAPNGTARAFAPGALTLLGMYRGLPVFVKAGDERRMRPELEALAARGVDLEKALQQRSSLRRAAERLSTVYVPAALTGCVFQPLVKTRR